MPVGGAEWYKEQPSNRNFLNPIGYLLKLEKFEGVDFFCQGANVPDISMPAIEVGSPFRSLPIVPGGGVSFGDFAVRFIVDEDLKNYYSIHKWMRDNGNADQMARTKFSRFRAIGTFNARMCGVSLNPNPSESSQSPTRQEFAHTCTTRIALPLF